MKKLAKGDSSGGKMGEGVSERERVGTHKWDGKRGYGVERGIVGLERGMVVTDRVSGDNGVNEEVHSTMQERGTDGRLRIRRI